MQCAWAVLSSVARPAQHGSPPPAAALHTVCIWAATFPQKEEHLKKKKPWTVCATGGSNSKNRFAFPPGHHVQTSAEMHSTRYPVVTVRHVKVSHVGSVLTLTAGHTWSHNGQYTINRTKEQLDMRYLLLTTVTNVTDSQTDVSTLPETTRCADTLTWNKRELCFSIKNRLDRGRYGGKVQRYWETNKQIKQQTY